MMPQVGMPWKVAGSWDSWAMPLRQNRLPLQEKNLDGKINTFSDCNLRFIGYSCTENTEQHGNAQ